MKKVILMLFFSFSIFTFGQKQEEVNLIQVDSTWGKEIIKIPFWFAPKIEFIGNEDIRFSKGWEDIKSDGFWSLVFAWDMNLKTKPTTTFFEENLKLYFDGLMKVVNEDTKIVIPKTEVTFSKNKQTNIFKGTLKTYDAFTTKKIIELNVIIEVSYCEKSKQYVPLFKMSPKYFKHKSWKILNKSKLKANICN